MNASALRAQGWTISAIACPRTATSGTGSSFEDLREDGRGSTGSDGDGVVTGRAVREQRRGHRVLHGPVGGDAPRRNDVPAGCEMHPMAPPAPGHRPERPGQLRGLPGPVVDAHVHPPDTAVGRCPGRADNHGSSGTASGRLGSLGGMRTSPGWSIRAIGGGTIVSRGQPRATQVAVRASRGVTASSRSHLTPL